MRSASVLSAAVAAGFGLAGCGSPPGIPSAIFPNRTDTLAVYAVTGTPVATPSAYIISARQVVRTDQNPGFDFVFDIDSLGRAVLLPTGAMKLGTLSGAQAVTTEFDSTRIAPTTAYHTDSAVVLDVNSVAVLHSRPVQCSWDFSPVHNFFAKLRVVAVDSAARRIDFEILTDINCGYRGLEPGLPHS
jgi:hypothetical protein